MYFRLSCCCWVCLSRAWRFCGPVRFAVPWRDKLWARRTVNWQRTSGANGSKRSTLLQSRTQIHQLYANIQQHREMHYSIWIHSPHIVWESEYIKYARSRSHNDQSIIVDRLVNIDHRFKRLNPNIICQKIYSAHSHQFTYIPRKKVVTLCSFSVPSLHLSRSRSFHMFIQFFIHIAFRYFYLCTKISYLSLSHMVRPDTTHVWRPK